MGTHPIRESIDWHKAIKSEFRVAVWLKSVSNTRSHCIFLRSYSTQFKTKWFSKAKPTRTRPQTGRILTEKQIRVDDMQAVFFKKKKKQQKNTEQDLLTWKKKQ